MPWGLGVIPTCTDIPYRSYDFQETSYLGYLIENRRGRGGVQQNRSKFVGPRGRLVNTLTSHPAGGRASSARAGAHTPTCHPIVDVLSTRCEG